MLEERNKGIDDLIREPRTPFYARTSIPFFSIYKDFQIAIKFSTFLIYIILNCNNPPLSCWATNGKKKGWPTHACGLGAQLAPIGCKGKGIEEGDKLGHMSKRETAG